MSFMRLLLTAGVKRSVEVKWSTTPDWASGEGSLRLSQRKSKTMIRTKSVSPCLQRRYHHPLQQAASCRIGSVQSFHQYSKRHDKLTLAIKAEHPHRLWERRTPLAPNHVRKLIEKFGESLAVKVESSQKRIFDDQSYSNVRNCSSFFLFLSRMRKMALNRM
jgi:hypothetical protein